MSQGSTLGKTIKRLNIAPGMARIRAMVRAFELSWTGVSGSAVSAWGV
jgi:hypothetical protein